MAQGPILVADDNDSFRQAVTDVLQTAGYAVVAVADGERAVAVLDQQRPALVLLDMRMPGLSGWGVAATIRARQLGVPIVVMTAARNAATWAAEIQADAYLAKPFELDELLAIVEQVSRPAPAQQP